MDVDTEDRVSKWMFGTLGTLLYILLMVAIALASRELATYIWR